MEDFNILGYNQHQLVKRAPTLITGPSLVFLTPTKKGLRSPIIKCKIPLGSNLMALLHNQPLLCLSLLLNTSVHHRCSSLLLIATAHLCFSSLLLITTTHLCCSSLLLISAAHLYCWSSLYTNTSFHCNTLLMQIIVHLIIHNY